MKIKEILAEEAINLPELLRKNCAPFLKRVGGFEFLMEHPLWRGLTRNAGFIRMIKMFPSPANRPPLDTGLDYHRAMDNWFFEHTGIRYRSNAFFTTGEKAQAEVYGNAYMFFPIGDFKFTWSPNVKDLTASLRDGREDIQNKVRDKINRGDFSYDDEGFDAFHEALEKEIKKYMLDSPWMDNFMKSLNYDLNSTSNLDYAIETGNEIMMHCDLAYLVNPESLAIRLKYGNAFV